MQKKGSSVSASENADHLLSLAVGCSVERATMKNSVLKWSLMLYVCFDLNRLVFDPKVS